MRSRFDCVKAYIFCYLILFLLYTFYRKGKQMMTENYREMLHKICGKSYDNCMFVACKKINILSVKFSFWQRNQHYHPHTLSPLYSSVSVTKYASTKKYKTQHIIWHENFCNLPNKNNSTSYQNSTFCATSIHMFDID